MDHYLKRKEAGYVRNHLGQRKSDYIDGGVVYGVFQASKLKLCYTIDKNRTSGEKFTLKRLHDTKRYLTLIIYSN